AQDIWQRRKICSITGATTCTTTITVTTSTALARTEEGSEVHVSNLALHHRIEQGRCGSSHEAEVRVLPPEGIEQFRLAPLQISGLSLSNDVCNHGGTRGDFLNAS